MGDIADWLVEQEIERYHIHWFGEYYESPEEIREKWYAARYKEERKARKMTLQQVLNKNRYSKR